MIATAVPALTTMFTPSTYCLEDLYGFTDTSAGSLVYAQLGPPPTSDCFPADFTPSSTAFYSPGICPSGYLIACSSIVNIGPVLETRATCCPSSYTCRTQNANIWPWYSSELCTFDATTTTTFLITDGTSVTSTYIGNPNFNAYGIQVRWQAPDSASVSSTTVSGSLSSTSSVLSTYPLTSVLSTPTYTPSSTGLSTGTKTGIGIGAGLGVLFVLLGAAFVLYRRRGRQPTEAPWFTIVPPVQRQYNSYEKAELADTG